MDLGEGWVGVDWKSARASQRKKMLTLYGKTWMSLIASPLITRRILWKKKIPRILRLGFPGLETALPLLLTAVKDGRLKIEDIIAKMVTNPHKIFSLPEQPETWIEVDEDAEYEIKAANQFTRCGWTPFEGWKVKGRVTRVVLRGREAFKDGRVLTEKGFGKNVRKLES